MKMSMNEKQALYAFGCPNREATVEGGIIWQLRG